MECLDDNMTLVETYSDYKGEDKNPMRIKLNDDGSAHVWRTVPVKYIQLRDSDGKKLELLETAMIDGGSFIYIPWIID